MTNTPFSNYFPLKIDGKSFQTERSQFQNRDTCMGMLKAKLIVMHENEHMAEINDLKGDMKKIEWGSQIRS